MKIGLISAKCMNNEVTFNTGQIIKYLENVSKDVIGCFFFADGKAKILHDKEEIRMIKYIEGGSL